MAAQYGYDSRDRLTQINQGGEMVSMVYDAYDRRTSTTLPNGVSTQASYNDLDQLTTLTYQHSGQVLGNLTYTYDDTGQIISKGGSWDTTAQVTLTSTPGSADAHNQLQQFDGLLYSYDAHGNLINDGVFTYTYDSRDRLVQMSGPGILASFGYDAANRRISKTINGQTTDYRYDGLNPIAEVTSTDTYEILPGQNLDERYGRDENAGRSYFLTDHQGSTIALTGAAGQVQARYHYEAYGETQFEAIEPGFSSNNPYQYTGRENDGTGLYHYRARYYSPTSKRFTQQDPLGMVDGPNQYAYVGGNPVSYTDPLGLYEWGDPLPQYFVDFSTGFGDAISFGMTDWIRGQMGTNGAVNKCSNAYNAGLFSGIGFGIVLGGTTAAHVSKAFGPLKQWLRFGPSYSKSLGAKTTLSFRWGASPVKNGKYIDQIGSPMLRRFNQWLRERRIPFSGWRSRDPGHFHIRK